MKPLQSGAYLTEDFSRGLDGERWAVRREDPAMDVFVEDGRLVIAGRTTSSVHQMNGIVARRPFPPDAILIVEMRVPTEMRQLGSFGFTAHLWGHFRHETSRRPPVDTGSDLTFGRYAGRVGWFHDASERTQSLYFKPSDHDIGREPFGDEDVAFKTVRVAYSERDHLLETAVRHEDRWLPIGRTQQFVKQFATVELKAESEASGLDLAVEFRNVRLFPHPARHPVKVIIGHTSWVDVHVTLSDPGTEELIAEAAPDMDRTALLWLPTEAVWPMSGHLRAWRADRVIDELVIEASGVQGLYPNDAYYAGFGMFHI